MKATENNMIVSFPLFPLLEIVLKIKLLPVGKFN